jgi:hypothetical protein
MAGAKGKSGRPANPGRMYRLNVRFDPRRHSAELGELLAMLGVADPQRRADILDRVAAGGLVEARAAAQPEVRETEALLEGLFG